MLTNTKDKILHFDNDLYEKYALSSNRGYSLAVFLLAHQLMDNPQTKLRELRAEYELVAKAFAQGPDADKIFFVDLIYEESQEVFHRLNVQQLPYVFLWSPQATFKRGGMIEPPVSDKLSNAVISKYPWPAEDMLKWFKTRSGLDAPDIQRPTFLNDPMFPMYALAAVATAIGFGYVLWVSNILRSRTLWCFICLLVFWFSVSGGMYNIIRGMPMFIRNKEGKIQFFLQGRQGQLGAEGFIAGGSYLLFSFGVSALTYAVPYVPNTNARRVLGFLAVLWTAIAAFKIFELHKSKTSYNLHHYLW